MRLLCVEWVWEPNPASQAMWSRVFLPAPPSSRYEVILIHLAALPGGAGVQIVSAPSTSPQQEGGVKRPALVYAGQRCTGS